jgi:ATP phosphoribosyltransferase regulatory subunit
MIINQEIFSNKEKAMFALRQLYASHGFSMYRMSKFEEFELYASNMDFLDSGQIITFTDTDGMLMALKPDVTLSIVKNNRHIGNRIIKLYYNENIYRVSPKTHYFKEIMQVGLECLGAVDSACISEVLLLAAESMQVLSDEPKLDVSNLDILTQLADPVLKSRVRALAAPLNLPDIRVLVHPQRSRWGSCSHTGKVTLNTMLILFPPEAVDYVILHELCHKFEMNHSERFKQKMDELCPDWRDRDALLRQCAKELPDFLL